MPRIHALGLGCFIPDGIAAWLQVAEASGPEVSRIVVPSARARRELLWRLAAAHAGSARVPVVATVGAITDALFLPPPGLPRAATALELQAAALSALHEGFGAGVLAAEGAASEVARRRLALELLRPTLNELAAAGVPPEDVAMWWEGRGGLDEARLWRSLAEWRVRIESLLEQRGVLGPLARRQRMIRHGARSGDRVVLAAVDDLPAIGLEALEAFERLGGHVDVLVCADEKHLGDLDDWGTPKDRTFLAEASMPVERCASPDDQAERVVGHWSALGGDAAIVIADAGMEAALARHFGMHGRTVIRSAERTLAETPAGAFLLRAVAWVESHSIDSLHALAADPALPTVLLARVITLRATHLIARPDALWRILREEFDGAPGRDGEDQDAAPRAALRAMFTIVDALDAAWDADAMAGALAALAPGPAQDVDAVSAAITEVTAAATGASVGDRRALLGSLLRQRPSASAAGEGDIQLFGWLEAGSLPASEVLLCGVHGASLPAPADERGLLRAAVRDHFRIASRDQRLARDAFRLAGLRARLGNRLRVFSPQADEAGTPLLLPRILLGATDCSEGPSRDLAKQVRELSAPPRGPQFIVREAGAARGAPDGPAARGDFEAVPSPLVPLLPTPLDAGAHSLPVTGFARWMRDPWSYWAFQRLGVEAVEVDAAELGGAALGDVLHAVWEALGQVESATAAQLTEVARRSLDRRLQETLVIPEGEWSAPVRVQARRLREAAEHLARVEHEQRSAGWLPVRSEWRVAEDAALCPRPPALRNDDGSPVIGLRGKVDRIEHHAASGRWRVLDLKTGHAAKPPSEAHFEQGPKIGLRWIDLQLPLYRHILAPGGVPPEVGYLLLPPDPSRARVVLADGDDGWTSQHFDGAVARAREIVREMQERQGLLPGKVGERLMRLARKAVLETNSARDGAPDAAAGAAGGDDA